MSRHAWVIFFHCVFLQSCVYVFLCVQAGEFDIRKRLKAYIALYGGTFICFVLLSFIFLSCLFFICVCHCLLTEKRPVTSCCQSVHRKTFCICICRKKVTAGSLLFWNLPFPNYKTGLLGSFKMCEMVEFIKKSTRKKWLDLRTFFSIHSSYEG